MTQWHYITKFNLDKNKIFVVPQAADVERFEDAQELPNTNKIILIYAGAFYPKLRDSTEFVKAINRLDNQNIEIIFVGTGNVGRFVTDKTKISTYPRTRPDKLVPLFQASNVLLYFDNAYGIQTSGKIFELLSIKKPILFIYSNPKSEVIEWVKSYPNILFCENNVESIIDCIKTQLPTMVNRTYEYDVKNISWQKRAEDFDTIFEKLIKI